jgi:hypothetical protein
LTADLDDEAVVMSADKGHYVALDPIARDIWVRIATPRPVADLCDMLVQVYAVPRATIESDVIDFLDEAVAAGLVTIQG